jgi:hypothetical protein
MKIRVGMIIRRTLRRLRAAVLVLLPLSSGCGLLGPSNARDVEYIVTGTNISTAEIRFTVPPSATCQAPCGERIPGSDDYYELRATVPWRRHISSLDDGDELYVQAFARGAASGNVCLQLEIHKNGDSLAGTGTLCSPQSVFNTLSKRFSR